MNIQRLFTFLFILLFIASCGSSGGATGDDDDDTDDSINTEKLVGTPFEGLTRGDDLDWDLFRCGQYRTETIDEFPIEIFTVFFTGSEEIVIQEGIDVANEAMGEEVYVLTDEWSDELRVIYKVRVVEGDDAVGSAIGVTLPLYFNFNGKSWVEKLAADWVIELSASGTNKWTVAHELGHASGIARHMRIDYDNDELVDLEENSLMGTDRTGEPAMDDYNFMMQMQRQIIEDHFGGTGSLELEACDEDD